MNEEIQVLFTGEAMSFRNNWLMFKTLKENYLSFQSVQNMPQIHEGQPKDLNMKLVGL